jgi:voltage-gated potassium channel
MRVGRKLIVIIVMLSVIFVVGVTGYMLVLRVGFIDALYMTVITISTVGFSEVAEMNDPAKLFSIVIILAGLGVVGYSFTSVVSFFFEGHIKDAWRKKRMTAKIGELRDHYIVCGAGDVGYSVIENFRENNIDFVVIEASDKRYHELEGEDIPVVLGDATHEETLLKAGLDKARGMVCTLSTDSDNVFTVLTARQLNERIYIVSRAVERSAHSKLLKAGANKTISPNELGGKRIAASVVRPSITSFLDVITRSGDVVLDLEEVYIDKLSKIAGMSLLEAKIPEQTGLVILALRKQGEDKFRFNPRSHELLEAGDLIIVLGTGEQIDKLQAIAN